MDLKSLLINSSDFHPVAKFNTSPSCSIMELHCLLFVDVNLIYYITEKCWKSCLLSRILLVLQAESLYAVLAKSFWRPEFEWFI